jgi:hypothetical protein
LIFRQKPLSQNVFYFEPNQIFVLRGFMRRFLSICFFSFITVSISFAQSREQSIEQLKSAKEQIKTIEQNVLSVEKTDEEAAKSGGLGVFRILPRETYGNNWSAIRGGGAYYSFSKKSHSYDETPQIELQQNNLSVGFAGADYGFISDLGETKLESADREMEAVRILFEYKPPTLESLARTEKTNSISFQNGEVKFQRSIPAIVGHTYVLRAISFERADVLVAFTIDRKDSDGSLIIFWKLIQQFEKTFLVRQSDSDLSEKIQKTFQENKINDVTYEVSQGIVSLNGSLLRLNEAIKLIYPSGPRGFVLKFNDR